MNPANILVIEDDKFVARTIERCLRGDQFRVTIAYNGMDGLDAARRSTPDLVILDVIMRGMDGLTVCREMRAEPLLAEVPILFLTAKVKTEDKIAGFRAGADDYLCKPFNLDELLLRVQAILRRTFDAVSFPPNLLNNPKLLQPAEPLASTDASHRSLVVGDYLLDTHTFELQTPHRGKVRLTPLQYDLLYHLMTHPGQAFSPTRLLNEVWDFPNGRGSSDLVRVHIKTLRDRIEAKPEAPTFLLTVRGRGYMVSAAEQSVESGGHQTRRRESGSK
jgi:DNA-binding response OmpR family regulator